MALWALAWQGTTPIGGPLVGWIAQTAGPRWALVVGGVPTLLCGVLAIPALTRIDRRAAGAGTVTSMPAPASAPEGSARLLR